MKTPLLLLPGLLADERLFAPQVEGLSDIAQVIVADLTGADTIAALAAASIAGMPPGRFAVAGLSMGGYVALEIARQAPERVAAIALLNTTARADPPEAIANRRRLIAVAEEDFAAVNRALVPRLLHPDHQNDARLVGLLDDMANAVGLVAFKRQQEAIIGRLDSRVHLAAIQVPALVLAGREDLIMPMEVSEEMARGIPGADLEVLEQCGHLSSLEQPGVVTARLRVWIQSATE